MESSRTHFEVLGFGLEGQVLGLGLEASSPRKLACPRLEDSSIFWIIKILWSAWKIFWKTFFCGDRLKNFCVDLFFFFEIAWKIFVKTFCFGEHLRLCPWSLALSIPVLGLESVCPRKGYPWPWPRIFFCVLGLEPCVLDSTSAYYNIMVCCNKTKEVNNILIKLFKKKTPDKISGSFSLTPYFWLNDN